MRSVDHVKAVAHVDERPLFGQVHLLEEVGHALREVLVLARDALDILQVAHLGRLDVHGVHVRALSLEQHATEEVGEALPQLLYDSNISMNFDVEQEGRAAHKDVGCAACMA